MLYDPDPSLIGEGLKIVLPREPIFLQVERSFYNARVADGSLKIDDVVFTHEIGDPSSYPTKGAKNSLLAANGGLQLGPQAVGQGAGSTELELAVSTAWGVGGALELGFEFESDTTIVGVNVGFTIGASVEATLQVSSGVSTSYTGTVGSIDAAHFQEHGYSFGLFTYVQADPTTGQEFEVINDWVE